MNTFLDIHPAYALAAAPAPPHLSPGFAQLSNFENFYLVPEIESSTDPALEEYQSFLPEEWVNQFDHNETHVKISAGNETFNLLWKDELVNLEEIFVHICSL